MKLARVLSVAWSLGFACVATAQAQRLEFSRFEDFVAPFDLRRIAESVERPPFFFSSAIALGANAAPNFHGRFPNTNVEFVHLTGSAQSHALQLNTKATWMKWHNTNEFPSARGLVELAWYLQDNDTSDAGRYTVAYVVERSDNGELQHGYAIALQVAVQELGTGHYSFTRVGDNKYLDIAFLYYAADAGPITLYWGVGYAHRWHSYRLPDAGRNVWSVEGAAEWYIRRLDLTMGAILTPAYRSRQSNWTATAAVMASKRIHSAFLGPGH